MNKPKWRVRKLHIVSAIMLLAGMVSVFYFFRAAKRFRLSRLISLRSIFSHIFACVFIGQMNLLLSC